MLERLFTSKTRVKLMTLFLMNPDKELHVREIVRLIDENVNAARRELTNLEDIGLLRSSRKGNLKQYAVNKSMPLYEELTAMILKTEGVAKILKEHIADLGRSASHSFMVLSHIRQHNLRAISMCLSLDLLMRRN